MEPDEQLEEHCEDTWMSLSEALQPVLENMARAMRERLTEGGDGDE